MFWAGLLIGLFVGANVGVLGISLAHAAKRADRWAESRREP